MNHRLTDPDAVLPDSAAQYGGPAAQIDVPTTDHGSFPAPPPTPVQSPATDTNVGVFSGPFSSSLLSGLQSPATDENVRIGIGIGCLACARAHFSTIAGSLKEAIRFAREDGLTHPEVQSRLQAAEEEVAVIERHDWTPEKTLNSPPGEKQVIHGFFPDLRRLRQQIMQIATVDDLERAAADAALLSTNFRLAVLELRGVDTGGYRDAAPMPGAGGTIVRKDGCSTLKNPEAQGSP